MKFRLSSDYTIFDQVDLREGAAIAWVSSLKEDTIWDDFLHETQLGQFQQSTIWSRAKAIEGWKAARVVVTMDDEIVAGFQVLWRATWLGRMAYISKGPVVSSGYESLVD